MHAHTRVPSLEAGKMGGENHLLDIALPRDGASYTGGRERKKHRGGGPRCGSCFA